MLDISLPVITNLRRWTRYWTMSLSCLRMTEDKLSKVNLDKNERSSYLDLEGIEDRKERNKCALVSYWDPRQGHTYRGSEGSLDTHITSYHNCHMSSVIRVICHIWQIYVIWREWHMTYSVYNMGNMGVKRSVKTSVIISPTSILPRSLFCTLKPEFVKKYIFPL